MADLTGRRILVTGAAGFVGANLIRRLIQDKSVKIHALVRGTTDLWRLRAIMDSIELVITDINDLAATRQLIQRLQPEIVFHLAVVRQHPDWTQAIHTNITATFNILQAAASEHLVRFIHTDSSLVYGAIPLQESAPLEPTSFYGANRAAAAILVRQFAVAESCPVIILRLFYVYGPWESSKRLIGTALQAAINGHTLPMPAETLRRDYVFIDDVVEACLLAVVQTLEPGQVINIGSGQQHSNEAVVAHIEEITGRSIQRDIGALSPRAWDLPDWVADIQLAKQVLGWEPQYALRQGLHKTIAWMRDA